MEALINMPTILLKPLLTICGIYGTQSTVRYELILATIALIHGLATRNVILQKSAEFAQKRNHKVQTG